MLLRGHSFPVSARLRPNPRPSLSHTACCRPAVSITSQLGEALELMRAQQQMLGLLVSRITDLRNQIVRERL